MKNKEPLSSVSVGGAGLYPVSLGLHFKKHDGLASTFDRKFADCFRENSAVSHEMC